MGVIDFFFVGFADFLVVDFFFVAVGVVDFCLVVVVIGIAS